MLVWKLNISILVICTCPSLRIFCGSDYSGFVCSWSSYIQEHGMICIYLATLMTGMRKPIIQSWIMSTQLMLHTMLSPKFKVVNLSDYSGLVCSWSSYIQDHGMICIYLATLMTRMRKPIMQSWIMSTQLLL